MADRGGYTDMSNTVIEDQFYFNESQDLHRTTSPIIQSGSQGSSHSPCVPLVGAMSNVALWSHKAFISTIELLYPHDREECLTRLHEAKEEILEKINAYENIGDAGLRANVSRRDDDGNSPGDNDGDSPHDPGGSFPTGNQGGGNTPDRSDTMTSTQGNKNTPASLSRSGQGNCS